MPTSCLVKLFSFLAFKMGISNSFTSSKQSFVGVATFMTCNRYLQETKRVKALQGESKEYDRNHNISEQE